MTTHPEDNSTPDIDPKALALAAHLKVDVSTIEECAYGDNTFESTEEPGEYLVLDGDEADQAWDEELEHYIDDVILDEFPKAYANYFDREAWKRDARHDGRGHSLGRYDGEEHQVQIDGTWYFIYRVN